MESTPGWLQTVINLSPMRHCVDVAYGIVLKGADFTTIAAPAVKMTLLDAFFSAAGVLRFRRQFR